MCTYFTSQMALSSPEVMQAMALMGPEAFNALLRGQNKSSNSDIQASTINNQIRTVERKDQNNCKFGDLKFQIVD